MISKKTLKELAAYRQQKRLDAGGLFVVEGPRLAAEALAWGASVVCTCATDEWLSAHVVGGADVGETYTVSQADLERLSLMRSPNQVWMLVRRGLSPLASALPSAPLTIALDRVQDPGNMGTMLRTADWFGIRHVVCSTDTVSCYNSKVVQASMGAVFRTRVEYVDLPQWLAACGMEVYGATLHGTPLPATPVATHAVLLVGNEGRGISAEAMAAVTRPVTIPNRGTTAESLNAAVAAAILIDKLLEE